MQDRKDHALIINGHLTGHINDSLNRLDAQVTIIDSRTQALTRSLSTMRSTSHSSDKANLKLIDVKARFDASITFVTDSLSRMKVYNAKIRECESKSDMVDNGLVVDGIDYSSAPSRTKDDKSDAIDKEIKRFEKKVDRIKFDIANHFESSIDTKGSTDKKSQKVRLDLESINLHKDKGSHLVKNVLGWLKSNAYDFALVIPFMERIAHEFDPSTGLHWDDFPSDANQFQPRDPIATLDSDRLNEFRAQNEKVYTFLTEQLNDELVSRHLLTRSYGLYDTYKRKGEEGDALTLFWCLLGMFKPTNSHHKTKLITTMNEMHKYFTSRASPVKVVQAFSPKLAECITLQIKLQYDLTVAKIALALSSNPLYSAKMEKYSNGTSNPDDCASLLDAMFDDIAYVGRKSRVKDQEGASRMHAHLASVDSVDNEDEEGVVDMDPHAFIADMFEEEDEYHEAMFAGERINRFRREAPRGINPVSRHERRSNRRTECRGKGCKGTCNPGHDLCLTCVGKGKREGKVEMKDGPPSVFRRDASAAPKDRHAPRDRHDSNKKRAFVADASDGDVSDHDAHDDDHNDDDDNDVSFEAFVALRREYKQHVKGMQSQRLKKKHRGQPQGGEGKKDLQKLLHAHLAMNDDDDDAHA